MSLQCPFNVLRTVGQESKKNKEEWEEEEEREEEAKLCD